MIIDTSALVAILRDEPEAEICARAIESDVEFIDENGGGPGVRLRKRQQQKS